MRRRGAGLRLHLLTTSGVGLALACTPPLASTVPADDPTRVDEAPAAPGPWIATRVQVAAIPCYEPQPDVPPPTTCELSGAAWTGHDLVVVNDKPIEGAGRSPVLRVPLDDLAHPTYVADATLVAFRKYEDIARLPDGALLITTGFDRVHPDDAQWDAYNAILRWPLDGGAPRVVAATEREGVVSSRTLRDALRRALARHAPPDGPAYFKVEGLAALDDGRILLGIRELGESHEAPRFVVEILAAADLEALGRGELTSVWRFAPDPAQTFGHPVGLSALAWDSDRDGLWLTTSWEVGETDEDLGGALWWLPRADFEAGRPPSRVLDPDGAPLVFAHKPEGVTVVAGGRLLVVHDDDRVTGRPADAIVDPVHQFARGLDTSAVELLELRRR